MIDSARHSESRPLELRMGSAGSPVTEANDVPLPAESFARLLIASLTLREADEIDLSYPRDRDRLVRLIGEIEKIIEEQSQPLARLTKDLIRIRNQISPSDSGAYDGFEELITAQQSWIVSRYNPSLDKIKLTIHPDIAKHLVGRAAPAIRSLVNRIVDAFLDQTRDKYQDS